MSLGFDSNFDQADVDPAAEFLAREQDELAGLEDEVKPAAISVPSALNGDDATNSVSGFEMIEGFEHDGLKKEAYADDFLFNTDPQLQVFDYGQATANGDGVTSSPLHSINTQEVREEPEKIRIWREEQVKRLEEKDREEERKKEELREIAKKELEDWYKNHEEIIAKTKAANRNAEKQFVAEDNDIEPGTEWERIAKLCEFNPKAKAGSKDVSRMRSIILQMKQNPMPIKNKS